MPVIGRHHDSGRAEAAIGIHEIRSEIPALRVENEPRLEALRLRRETYEDRVGVQRIARMAPGQETSDLCVAAARKLFSGGQVAPSEIECLLVVTQNPDGYGLPQTSAIVHGKLGLPESCACFDIGLGCSGYVYGLSVAKSFMQDNGFRRGLLFTADPYSRIIDQSDRRTALLFGDAAAVTLLGDDPVWDIGRFDMGTIGSQSDSLEVRIKPNGKLYMDGRAVLEFSRTKVPSSIHRAIERNGMTPQQIDRVILHQGSKVVVDTIAEALNMKARPAFHAQQYGNTISSSIPIVMSDVLQTNDRTVAISGFGVGLSWASTVLTRRAS